MHSSTGYLKMNADIYSFITVTQFVFLYIEDNETYPFNAKEV